ncbi:MAG: DUF2332 domain-containing protein [Henriciella sp.]
MWSGPKDALDFTQHCREQADWCDQLGSPFTASLCRAFADDFEAGGIIARLAGTVAPPHRKRATALRLAGALHHAVIAEKCERLAALYPSAGGEGDIAAIWAAASAYLKRDFDAVATFIQSDPQTNETRRSIALLPGFQAIADRFGHPLHLLELGASAGLNQCWDKFSYDGGHWKRSLGLDRGVIVATDWRGNAPEFAGDIQVASRAGCDLNPIDLRNLSARQRLKSYTWADQPERLTRLDAAMAVAVREGVSIDQADAADWLEKKLAARPSRGTSVVFHSVFLHYPPRQVRDRLIQLIEEAGAAATDQAPLAWLCMEPDSVFTDVNPKLGRFQVRLQTWPEGGHQILGYTDGHVTYFEPL